MKMPFVYQREIVLFGQHDCDPVYESTLWGGAGRGRELIVPFRRTRLLIWGDFKMSGISY